MATSAIDPRLKRGATLIVLGLVTVLVALFGGAAYCASALTAYLHPSVLPGETELHLPKGAYCIFFHEWPRAHGMCAPVNPFVSASCPPPCPLFKVDFAVTNVKTGEIVSVSEAGGAGLVHYAIGKRGGHGLGGFVVPEDGDYRIVTKYRADAGDMPPMSLAIGEDFEPPYNKLRSTFQYILGAGALLIAVGIVFCVLSRRARIPVASVYRREN